MECRWSRDLRCAALCAAPMGLVFGMIALYLQASGQPVLPGKQAFDGLWAVGLYAPLQLVIASGSVWAFLLMTLDDVPFFAAAKLASRGHSLNALWLWTIVTALVFVVCALRWVPILSLPFAAFVGASSTSRSARCSGAWLKTVLPPRSRAPGLKLLRPRRLSSGSAVRRGSVSVDPVRRRRAADQGGLWAKLMTRRSTLKTWLRSSPCLSWSSPPYRLARKWDRA
jgi:hypothetical protein